MDELLQKICDSLREEYFPEIEPVKIVMRDEPIFDDGTAAACWLRPIRTICVKPEYVQKYPYKRLVNTIKHELLHAWVDSMHDEPFRDMSYGHHGYLFMLGSIQAGVDISSVLKKYPEAKEAYEQAKKYMAKLGKVCPE